MRVLVLTVIGTLGLSTLPNSAVVVAQTSQHKSSTPAKKAPAPLSPEEREAQKHYRIALEALKNNDLSVASQELTEAARLAPKNALILYNLAVVEEKNGNPESAMQHLHDAVALQLPTSLAEEAEALEAKLAYGLKKHRLDESLAKLRTYLPATYSCNCEYPPRINSIVNLGVAGGSIQLAEVPDSPVLSFHVEWFENYGGEIYRDPVFHRTYSDLHKEEYFLAGNFQVSLADLNASEISIQAPENCDLAYFWHKGHVVVGHGDPSAYYVVDVKLRPGKSYILQMTGTNTVHDQISNEVRKYNIGKTIQGDSVRFYFNSRSPAQKFADFMKDVLPLFAAN